MMTAQQSAPEASTYPHGPPADDTSASTSTSSSMSGGHTAPAADAAAPEAVREDAIKSESAANSTEDKPQPTKKSRRELPPHTVAILKGWMLSREHVKHPYPTDEDKQMLLKKTGISMKQLTNWFTNARKRIWKPMMRREHNRQMANALENDKIGYRLPREFPGSSTACSYATTGATGPQGYGTARPTVRHSFDAGSLGAPPHGDHYMTHSHMQPQPQLHPHPATSYPLGASLYPPRAGRSMSEAPAATDMDDYIDAMRIRKRVHERGEDGSQPSEKRFRHAANSLSPRGLKVLQDWVAGSVAARPHAASIFPNDQERLQLAQETGLDVSQVDGWIQSLHDRGSGPSTAAVAAPTTSAMRSIPSRDNPQFPPPPVYGERRSIPSSGNPMFPPRPSVPSRDNPQFPPPPASRSDGYYARFGNGATSASSVGYSGDYDPARPARSFSTSTTQFLHPPPQTQPPAKPQPPGALPSLSSRNLISRPTINAPGPTMGQPRDGRSRTLDMGQFADARRRKMNFQDILASTGGAAATSAAMGSDVRASTSNAENMYPNGSSAQPTATYASVTTSTAANSYMGQKTAVCGRCGGPEGGCNCGAVATSGEQASGRVV